MRTLLKLVAALVVIAVMGFGGAWVYAGRQAGPTIAIRQPATVVGQASTLEVALDAPGGQFSHVEITAEQNGKTFPVFTLAQHAETSAKADGADRLVVMRPIGKAALPQLQAGTLTVTVRAARPVLRGLRQAESTLTKQFQVRLEPPRVAVLSTKHYINHGGSEFVVFTATPADVESGVKVGDVEYRSYPAAGAGIPGDATRRVAVIALLHDQPLNAPITVFARDAAGNQATAPVDAQAFEKPFQKSPIEVTDRFLQQVVPNIVANTPGLNLSTAPADLVTSFVAINSTLRRQNGDYIAALAQKSGPTMLWQAPFQQLGNSQVEARFADARTYLSGGKEIDHQTHLGFDLAVTANVPVAAAQKGVVVHAAYLGIYGNCVILDHGLGVQSLYAHLSSIDVRPGASMEKGQILGKSGMTGLAGGDHLHFTMLVGGHPVNPVDWWDQKWMQDRVLRKITEAGGTPGTAH